jgi:hypothetical protein
MVAGCATMSGGVAGDLSRSIDEVSSATETALVAVTQNDDGRATDAVTRTTLGDMMKSITQAETDAAEVDATTRDEARIRSDVLDATRASVDAVNAASLALEMPGDHQAGLDAALAGLDAAAATTKALSEKLERYQ